MTVEGERPRSKKRRILIGLIGAGAALTLIGVVGVALTPTPAGGEPLDMNGNRVTLDPGTVPTADVQKEMNIVDDIGDRFAVPSVNLDVSLGILSEASGTITPPGFTSAYLVRNLGVSLEDAADGTVFVATHSTRGGAVSPGNYLIDTAAGTSQLANGSTIQVGPLTYTVTGWQSISKEAITRDAGVWGNTPRRLVVLTCLQVPANTPSANNLVIFAELQD